MLDEVFKVLGVDKLDEAQQNSISEKIETMIEMKARERADNLLKEEKEALVEEFEAKFEDYKKDITSKFSDFVDSVLDEELEIPEKVMKYAKQGELYSELIEQFKIKLAIDEGLLDEEVKGLLKEAKEEILKLKKDVNSHISKEMELKEDAKTMASQLYLRKKCDGLLESQKQKVYTLLEGVTDKTEIDKKFKYVTDHLFEQVEPGTEVPAGEAASNACICPKCGAQYSFEGEAGTGACPKCGASMEDAKASVEDAEPDGNGHVDLADVKEVKESVNESTSPFDTLKSTWVRMLKENKI